MTWSVLAICGTHLGDTKLPASTAEWPAADSASIKATLASTETGFALVLQPVARPDFDEPHALGMVHRFLPTMAPHTAPADRPPDRIFAATASAKYAPYDRARGG
jgi:hypothetical protein